MTAVLRPQLRNLRRAMLGGGPDPPPLLAPAYPIWMGRAARGLLVFVAIVLALLALDYGYGWVDPIELAIWTLSVLPLGLVGYRPLLAWRAAWLLGLAAVVLSDPVRLRPAGPLYVTEIGGMDWLQIGSGQLSRWFPGQLVVFLVILFAVGTAQHRGVLLWVWLATVGLVWVAMELQGAGPLYWGGVGEAEAWAVAMLMVTGVMLAGYLVRLGARAQHRLAVVEEHGTVLTERARIARELHDVVAHHISMIAVRAETAPYRLGELSEPARTELAEISQASREALTEMRRLLGVLRSEQPEPLTAPQPGVADLPKLVHAATAAGSNEVTLDIDASLPDLPAAVDVSAYRIVQEALTNAAQHAPGAPVRVLVGRSGPGLSLSVRNGPGRGSPVQRGPGHGVRGMRERASMLGGDLSAAPTADGGFEVSATLPVALAGGVAPRSGAETPELA
jgi:signal transduction histidine kinase